MPTPIKRVIGLTSIQGFIQGTSLAVDSQGNVFIAQNNNFGGPPPSLYAYANPVTAGAATTTMTQNYPNNASQNNAEIAVDGNDTLYVLDLNTTTGSQTVKTYSYIANSFLPKPTDGIPIVVTPGTISSNGSQNVLEVDTSRNTPVLNTFTNGVLSNTFSAPLGTQLNNAINDSSTSYTYVLTGREVQVYNQIQTNGASVIPIARIILSNLETVLAVDTNYIYVGGDTSHTITAYPKYNPLKPYSVYKKPQ